MDMAAWGWLSCGHSAKQQDEVGSERVPIVMHALFMTRAY
jgi:hypothetical protein